MFEIIIEEFGGSDLAEIEGAVESPLLDPDMHPKRKLGLYISSRSASNHENGGVILDSFQIDSLRQYLRGQKSIRRTLERELPKHQAMVDPDGEPVRGNVWSWARVRLLKLRARDLRPTQMIKRLKEAGRKDSEINELLPMPEKASTKSLFVVVLKCDWCQDGKLEATFRDGRFVALE